MHTPRDKTDICCPYCQSENHPMRESSHPIDVIEFYPEFIAKVSRDMWRTIKMHREVL